ncbi:mannitol dehydrogenase [Brevirhabdus pacifica]|uniref:Mannitol dehydrogenase n=1 Tax=Brevirhabdus pacifica TaxID=1267768 RepID=A0A1U7DIU1_9RHOB|nr:mannitol dehydrogenase family protein [Brevirhabdus pacifica]APX89917.1 mannitol dehydrogenase [Brevirhabdus pacifica]OWU74357.1 mannitol dehydrogenase [Loktanella sp. 22II-4b]PJJ82855.1 mannitol 2-dehydrogenase [Brevirhabdus pacifica]
MDELIPLSDATLDRLPAAVGRPRYDRRALRPGIVHIGLGNFHRAHQAWYLHRLMQAGQALNWAIVGAGVRPADTIQRDRLLAQDCLTTLISLDPGGSSAEVIGPMIDFLPVEEDNAALIRQMADPAIRIVALTVTEGGYYRTPTGEALDTAHPDIRHDAENPYRPRTAFGAMVAALALRRRAGLGAFTAMSCDNLQGNGAILRRVVVSLARLSDPGLADWIEAEASFPNSMVDCIVPATGPKEIALARSLGIDDRSPVTHESFRQWVIEDDFCAGRPDWDRAGAIFSDRVHDWEAMKIRLLNASHQLLANAGEILGVETIAACMNDADIAGFFRNVVSTEIAPHVAPVPGMTPAAYIELVARRFANPAIIDTTRRVAFDGASRHPGFLLPVLRDALAAGTQIEGLALAEALWCRMCAGTREDGSPIPDNDPNWASLQIAALAARDRPAAWLEQSQIYGDLGADGRFADSFGRWLTLLWTQGCRATLHAYGANGGDRAAVLRAGR